MAKKKEATADTILTLEQVKELLEDGAVKVKGKLIQMKDEEESVDDWQNIIAVAEDAITEIENDDGDEDEDEEEDDEDFDDDEDEDEEEDDEDEDEDEG